MVLDHRDILYFLIDLMDLTLTEPFDGSTFQSLIQIGVLQAKKAANQQVGEDNHSIHRHLLSMLEAFKIRPLRTGLAMESIWAALKPNVTTDLAQLNVQSLLEDAADQFDELVWHADLSLNDHLRIQKSLLALHASTGISKPDESDLLKVMHLISVFERD